MHAYDTCWIRLESVYFIIFSEDSFEYWTSPDMCWTQLDIFLTRRGKYINLFFKEKSCFANGYLFFQSESPSFVPRYLARNWSGATIQTTSQYSLILAFFTWGYRLKAVNLEAHPLKVIDISLLGMLELFKKPLFLCRQLDLTNRKEKSFESFLVKSFSITVHSPTYGRGGTLPLSLPLTSLC